MKPYIQTLLIIAFALLCFVIGCNWNRVPSVEGDVKSDTVYVAGPIQHFRDTIKVVDSFPYPVAYKAEVVNDSTQTDSTKLALCDSTRNYQNSIEDSNALIVVETKVQGVMLDQTITAQVYKDSMVQHDTTFIYKTVTKYKPVLMPFLEYQNSPYPLSIGIMYGKKRTFIGGKVDQKGNVSGFVGYNLLK